MASTKQRAIYAAAVGPTSDVTETITIGYVVDTNDPQQMGRVRAVCPVWGDSYESPVEDIPWSLYITPFGGQTRVGARGPGIQPSEGGISYGMWAIPKVGAQVLVMCVDGDPQHRVYMGCLYDQFTPHTMPHGRWKFDDHPELEKSSANPKPYGPYTSLERFIEPLAENLREAFAFKDDPSFEWRTRAADYQVAAIDVRHVNSVYGNAPDDKQIRDGQWESTQGYQISRINPDPTTSVSNANYDSMTYSWTSPGFHAISMDDRQENCRVRFRSTAGHQIIMDDTNERIYIQTAKGNNWVEMDQAGNIDIFTTNKVNIRSQKDINLTSDETIRMHAKKGIHMYSGTEIRTQAVGDIHTKSAANIRTHADASIYTEAATDIHNRAGSDIRTQAGGSQYHEAGGAVHIRAGSNLHLTAGGSFNGSSGGLMKLTGSIIHLNGPAATPASPAAAQTPAEQPAMWTNRVPSHEPYGRVMTKDDFTHEPEVPYESESNGRVERGTPITRGMYWRR